MTHHFIDRRPNPKGRSDPNKQRFIHKARKYREYIIREALKSHRLGDEGKDIDITIPRDETYEPHFRNGRGGYREGVLPGNRNFSGGEKIRKPSGGGGSGNQGGTGDPGEDTYRFTWKEVLDQLFESMALPPFLKRTLGDSPVTKSAIAGYTTSAPPSRLAVRPTIARAFGRRIALRSQRERAARKQIHFAESNPSFPVKDLIFLYLDLWRAEQTKRVPFLDDLDLRFRNQVQVPKPIAKAVMFCLMDVSSSMDEQKKDMAKRFFLLLYLFLKTKYEHVEIIYIRHTDTAELVDHDTFFFDKLTGGTIVASALNKMLGVINEKYPTSQWNIFGAQASDGDSFDDDPAHSTKLLQTILGLVEYFAYVEVKELDLGATLDPRYLSNLWKAYITIDNERLAMSHITNPAEVPFVLQKLFNRSLHAVT